MEKPSRYGMKEGIVKQMMTENACMDMRDTLIRTKRPMVSTSERDCYCERQIYEEARGPDKRMGFITNYRRNHEVREAS